MRSISGSGTIVLETEVIDPAVIEAARRLTHVADRIATSFKDVEAALLAAWHDVPEDQSIDSLTGATLVRSSSHSTRSRIPAGSDVAA